MASIFLFEIRKLRFYQKYQSFSMFSCVHYSFPIFDWLCLNFQLDDFTNSSVDQIIRVSSVSLISI